MSASIHVSSVVGGGVLLGLLLAASVPTRMKAAPEPYWRQHFEDQQASAYGEETYLVEDGPIDLSPHLALRYDALTGREWNYADLPVPDYEPVPYDERDLAEPAPSEPAVATEPAPEDEAGLIADAAQHAAEEAKWAETFAN